MSIPAWYFMTGHTCSNRVVVAFQICCPTCVSSRLMAPVKQGFCSKRPTCPHSLRLALTFPPMGDVTRLQTHQTAGGDAGAPRGPSPDVPFSAFGLLWASRESQHNGLCDARNPPPPRQSLGFPRYVTYKKPLLDHIVHHACLCSEGKE